MLEIEANERTRSPPFGSRVHQTYAISIHLSDAAQHAPKSAAIYGPTTTTTTTTTTTAAAAAAAAAAATTAAAAAAECPDHSQRVSQWQPT
jgi:hypothetical protein